MHKLRLQRNILFLGFCVSLLSNLILSFAISTQDQKTIIIPSIAAEYEISNNYVSDNYLKNFTIEINNLVFSLNNENIENISSSLFKLVAPEAAEKFKALEAAGVNTVKSPADIGKAMQEATGWSVKAVA